ncbi:MAG: hypothetical protein QW165_05465 [Candidatus Woesearchaeota archaeon]
MELWGFHIGRKKKLADKIREKLEKDISETLEKLVGSEIKRLRETADLTAKQRDEAQAALASRNIDLETLKSRFEALRNITEAQKYQIETESERLRVELFDYIEEYLRANPSKVLLVVRAMRDRNLLYAKEFFRTCIGIDRTISDVPSAEVPYGLQMLEAYEEGCRSNYQIDIARAVTWYTHSELKGIQKDHRLSAFEHIIDTTKRGDFKKATEEYTRQQIHRDYVLTLTKTERDLIRIRDERFAGSWTSMLKTAEQTGKNTREITLQEETSLTAPLIRKLMDYEQKNNVVLEYSGKDF